MRETTAWRESLARDLKTYREVYGPLPMAASRLLYTELVLTLMHDHLPGENPERAWAILNGYAFSGLRALPEESQQAIAIARLLLPEPLGRGTWERWLSEYQHLPGPYQLYCVQGSSITLTNTSVLPQRLDVMRTALTTPPAWKSRPPRYATAGTYQFSLDRTQHEVTIPPDIYPSESILVPKGRTNIRPPLSVSIEDLRKEAEWIDAVAAPGSVAAQSWAERIRTLQLKVVRNGELTISQALTVDGMLHLIGMVGSGKSSLFTVLAVYLARRGQRVVIVQGDVASLLREHAVFAELSKSDPRIRSVPLVGRSTRTTHLNRLTVAEASIHGPSISRDHAAYPMLSTVCPLDGWRRDVSPIQAGKEPCTRLYLRDKDETEAHRRDCPLMPVCPIHQPTRELMQASIWLATPASLLASSPQTPLVPEQIRNAELVMRATDLVLVDEADLVQIQFDDRFAQVEVLVGRNDSWLDRLAMQVARQVYRPGRPLVGTNAGLDRWLTAHTNTQRAVDRLYFWLRERMDTRLWLGQSYYSGSRLLQRVGGEIAQVGGDAKTYEEAYQAFNRMMYGGVRAAIQGVELPVAWEKAIHAELFSSQAGTALRVLKRWLQADLAVPEDIDESVLEMLAHHLRIALIVGVLDHALQDVILEWPAAAEELDLNRGSGGLFFAPSDSLTRMVPEAPMGAILGFQYFDPENRGEGELRFFHIRGVGRSLLYHLHDGMTLTDGIIGPHVILTSATSVAPSSWRYHLHAPPQALLLPKWAHNESPAKGQHVHCFFESIPDPARPGKALAISQGLPPAERVRRLRAMVSELARKNEYEQESRFDRELALLPEDRKRILIVVGRYDEAEEVEAALTEALRAKPGESVVALIPDPEADFPTEPRPGRLLRSRIAQFPKLTATFLIAPLQSVERGHNILVGQEAAIGSVYFLVRPIPVPGDPHTAVQRMNAWAMRYVDTLDQLDITTAGQKLRENARRLWDETLRAKESYRGSADRTALLWTQLVLVWQCIGRLLRGGVDARVHFMDAKWAEARSGLVTKPRDTEETSMLVGFQRILNEALTDPDPVQRAFMQALYAPFAEGLGQIEGVTS